MQFWSLGWEDPLERRMATHSNILAWRVPMDRGAWWATVHGVSQSDMTQWLNHHHQWKAFVFHSSFCFHLFVDQSASKLFLKGKKWRRAQFLPLPAVCVQWGHNCPGNWSEWYQLDACQKTSKVGVLSPLGGSSFLKRIRKQMKETGFSLENCF